jgi:hypothetical protein
VVHEDRGGEVAVKTFAVFPTWVLLLLAKRWLPTNHPWRYRTFTLQDWARHGTPLLAGFGVFFWFQLIQLPLIFCMVLKEHL